ncbi:MAG: dienelactone hydrolase family protein [Chloroflexi bacterium]|nr:dienelactone hydrolase family protein [Chloroflexota bacterium]
MGLTRDVSFTTADGLTLEGVLHRPSGSPSPGIVVCHPHPLYGGDMHNNVVNALCRAAVAGGIAALRFNFRGVGASQGSFGDGIGERADAEAALQHLRGRPEIDASRSGLVGYSFGAAVALLAAGHDLCAVVAVSTPTIARGLSDIDVRCPALLVVGDRDEVAPPSRLSALAAAIPGAELAVVPGADHFWWGSEDRLARIVSDFLGRHLDPSPAT